MGRLVHLGGADSDHRSCASIGPVHIDLGVSYQARKPVIEVLGERIPRTLFLAIAAVLVQVVIGVVDRRASRRSSATPSFDYGTVAMTLWASARPRS